MGDRRRRKDGRKERKKKRRRGEKLTPEVAGGTFMSTKKKDEGMNWQENE